MNVHEFILKIDFHFKMDAKDPQKLKDVYLSEFQTYPGERLDKVWESVRRHHKKSFAPVIGEILDCMDKDDVKESKSFSDSYKFYYHCEHCGCNFLIRSVGCPVCSWRIKENRPARTKLTVHKCKQLPDDLKFINEICMQCTKFKKGTIPMGAKCSAWNRFDYTLKAGKDCDNCPCYDCCNEVPAKRNIETGKIIQTLLDRKKDKYGDEDILDVNAVIPPM